MGVRTSTRMSDPELGELDELRRVGILTEAEYAEAYDKVLSRRPLDLLALPAQPAAAHRAPSTAAEPAAPGGPVAPRHAVPLHTAAARPATPRGRHAKPPKRWPWVAAVVVAVAAAVAVGVALRPAAHHSPRTHQA